MYSKQYIEIWGDKDYTPTFDIEKIAKEMYNGRYYPIKCLGFGIECIHKDKEGKVWVAHTERDGFHYDWETYEDLIKGETDLLEVLKETLQTI
jgi:hypothetical protein